MMKKTWLGVATLTLLAGCGPTHHILDEGVSNSREVHPVIGRDGDYLGSVAFRKPRTEANDGLHQRCLRATLELAPVEVESKTLSTPGTEGAYPFNERPADMQSERETVSGTTDYQGRTFGYRLELQQVPEANYYYFDRLGEREAGTDDEAPDYVPIGAWSEAEPMAVHEALEGVADRLQACLSRVETDSADQAGDQVEDPEEIWMPAPGAAERG